MPTTPKSPPARPAPAAAAAAALERPFLARSFDRPGLDAGLIRCTEFGLASPSQLELGALSGTPVQFMYSSVISPCINSCELANSLRIGEKNIQIAQGIEQASTS
ncbi:hypothetical protein VPH35_107332 [Triticum aestivum]